MLIALENCFTSLVGMLLGPRALPRLSVLITSSILDLQRDQRDIRRVSEIVSKYNHKFIKTLLKFIFHDTNYIRLDSVQCGESVLKLLKKSPKRRRN